MLRWETPVQGVVRVTTEDTEIGGCPVAKGQVVTVMLGSANTDERAWDDVDTDRLRPGRATATSRSAAAPTAASGRTSPAWSCGSRSRSGTRPSPTTGLRDGVELRYSQGLRAVENLELVW